MKKVLFLISHEPIPRNLKRIKTLEQNFYISLIYWNRKRKEKESFEINLKHDINEVSIEAPLGKPLKRIIPLLKYMKRVIRILLKNKPDIIHAGNLDMLFIAVLYKKILRKNVKLVYEVADLPKYAFIKKYGSPKNIIALCIQYFEKHLTRSCSKLILTSPYFWKVYYSKFIDEDKYLYIPNAPSKKVFENYVDKRINRKVTIGFIGSVRYINQIKMLIDVVEEMNKDVNILIAGGGPAYGELAEHTRNKSFVEMYGPYNYENDIVSLYEKVDIIYSVYDTSLQNVKVALPNRLYEAIVCNIPIIGAKDTALGKFIEKYKIGITVSDTDSDELKYQLTKLLKSDELLKMIKSNCNKISANFYYENNSENLLNEYIRLIE